MKLQTPSLADGEKYIGAIGNKDGDAYHLILLPGDNDVAPHSNQMWWAKSIGGDLPSKLEAAMLFAHARDEFKPAWYWTNETFVYPRGPDDAAWAWYQYFNYGFQISHPKVSKLRARAVRRLVFE